MADPTCMDGSWLVLVVVLPVAVVLVPTITLVVPISVLFVSPIVSVVIVSVAVSVPIVPSPAFSPVVTIGVVVAEVPSAILKHPNLLKTPRVPVEIQVAVAVVVDYDELRVAAVSLVPPVTPLDAHPGRVGHLSIRAAGAAVHSRIGPVTDSDGARHRARADPDVGRHSLGNTGLGGADRTKGNQSETQGNLTSDHGILRLNVSGHSPERASCQRTKPLFDKWLVKLVSLIVSLGSDGPPQNRTLSPPSRQLARTRQVGSLPRPQWPSFPPGVPLPRRLFDPEHESFGDAFRAFIDECVVELNEGTLTTEKASMAKWWCTEMAQRVADKGLQLFGGYGYMQEYPISRIYTDNRVALIYGGSNEIMKEIIGRKLVAGD